MTNSNHTDYSVIQKRGLTLIDPIRCLRRVELTRGWLEKRGPRVLQGRYKTLADPANWQHCSPFKPLEMYRFLEGPGVPTRIDYLT